METGKANNIQASTFNIAHYEQYHLAVEIGLRHLSYCIINNKTYNVEYLNKFIIENDCFDLINEDEIIKLDFASSSVVFTDLPSTLIPDELFDKENSKKILELTSNVYDLIRSDLLSDINTHLIYTIPDLINDIAFTFFPNAKQKAQQSLLIEQFIKLDENKNNAYIYIGENSLNITAFKNGKLLLNNSFDFETKEDILYYTLFAFEQLKLNTETVSTRLYGEIIKGDEKHQLLYEYIRNIKFGSRPHHLNFSSEFNKIPEHQFYGLFSQYI